MSIPDPTISFVTEHGILLEFVAADSGTVDPALQRRLCQLATLLRQHSHTGPLLCDIVTAPGSLLLVLHDGRTARRLLRHAETLWRASAQKTIEPKIVTIPVVYGGEFGPDLEQAARVCGLCTTAFVECHAGGNYFVQSLGFMPGFAYLGGLHPQLHIKRKDTPSARVPAGSVAIGGSNTGIYPSESPGGWHIIGRTSVTLFDAHAQQPCLLQPGDTVRFIAHKEQQS
jgi:5-oxoprolinase (ATP-hydrolysing) subunit B